MSNPIGWCDRTWNPVTGCTPVSEACEHCYAERMAKRLAGRFGYFADDPFQVTWHPDKMEAPHHWRKPQRIFTCSMGDLFHDDVPHEWQSWVFDVMGECQQHTFLVLTKRPENMKAFMLRRLGSVSYPPRNVWLGVTAETQARADERIPVLLRTPAAKRFVSCEPLLRRVDLGLCQERLDPDGCYEDARHGLDLVIVGGENGPGARPMDPQWAKSIEQQCQDAGVDYYYKGPGRG